MLVRIELINLCYIFFQICICLIVTLVAYDEVASDHRAVGGFPGVLRDQHLASKVLTQIWLQKWR